MRNQNPKKIGSKPPEEEKTPGTKQDEKPKSKEDGSKPPEEEKAPLTKQHDKQKSMILTVRRIIYLRQITVSQMKTRIRQRINQMREQIQKNPRIMTEIHRKVF